MHPDEHRMLNTTEAARYLGLGEGTLTKLRHYGGGPVFLKLGRRVTYDPRDLAKWGGEPAPRLDIRSGHRAMPPAGVETPPGPVMRRTPPKNPGPLRTVAEAAEILNVSERQCAALSRRTGSGRSGSEVRCGLLRRISMT